MKSPKLGFLPPWFSLSFFVWVQGGRLGVFSMSSMSKGRENVRLMWICSKAAIARERKASFPLHVATSPMQGFPLLPSSLRKQDRRCFTILRLRQTIQNTSRWPCSFCGDHGPFGLGVGVRGARRVRAPLAFESRALTFRVT